MIHIEKNPVLHANEYLIDWRCAGWSYSTFDRDIVQFAISITGYTTIIDSWLDGFPLLDFVSQAVDALKVQHGKSHEDIPVKATAIRDKRKIEMIVISIGQASHILDIVLRPISGRLDIDQSLNSKVNP